MSEQIQYIGARYVVKVYENSTDPSSAEWQANVNYEPLVMVTLNNGSYLSKKDVPASIGNPADNPTYWAQTGFYNGQILELQNRCAQLQEAINNEASSRELADGAIIDTINELRQSLSTEIMTEKSVRISADNNLSERINNEVSARETADDNLSELITQNSNAISSEVSARTSADNVLQAEIDQIIAPSGEAPSAAEVENARVGADGVTYNTLGDAIRTQITNVNGLIDAALSYTNGGVKTDGTIDTELTNYWHSNLIACLPHDSVKYVAKSTNNRIAGIAFYDIDENFIGCLSNNASSDSDEVTTTTPDNCYYLRITVSQTQHTNDDAYIRIVRENERNSFIKKYADTATITELYKDNLQIESTVAQFSNTELRTFARIYDNVGVIAVINSNPLLRFSWVLLDSSGTQIDMGQWRTGTEIVDLFKYPTVAGLRIRIQYTDQSNIDVSEASNISVVRRAVMQYTNEILNGNIIYVDGVNGSDANDGRTRSNSKKTISNALLFKPSKILVASGTYEPFVVDDVSNLYVGIDRYYDDYTAGVSENNPHIVIDGQSTASKGVEIKNCNNITLDSIEVHNCTTQGIIVTRSQAVKIVNCISHDIYNADMDGDALGIASRYSDVDCVDCLVYNIGTDTAGTGNTHSDGFNFHNTGVCNLYNCRAYNCDDDGVSHHDATVGIIENGEFSYCGKAGIASPASGATVNVSNVYCHHSKEGLYAANSVDSKIQPNILIFNSVFKDNTLADVYSNNFYHLVLANCIYDTLTGSNVTVY